MLKNARKFGFGMLLFMFFQTTNSVVAQEYKANYTFVEPKATKELSAKQYQHLTNVLKSAYASDNAFSNQSSFLVIPKITIISEKIAGEIDIVKVVKLKIEVTIQNEMDGFVFNKLNKHLIATGADTQSAITKAINSFEDDVKINVFFSQSNQKIVAFYENNCANLLSNAKVAIERKEYKKAFNFLKYVPEKVSCFEEVESITTKIFLDTKEANYQRLIRKAEAAEAAKNYKRALSYLKYIEPNNSSYAKALEMIKQMGILVDKKLFQDFEAEKEAFNKLDAKRKLEAFRDEMD